ncbi:hypothetical protein G4228_007722 [Cervus hanglu yarkandensis]|nr:hypothetical protein G4228_007722 [Cervus hanglu yarkandensis]
MGEGGTSPALSPPSPSPRGAPPPPPPPPRTLLPASLPLSSPIHPAAVVSTQSRPRADGRPPPPAPAAPPRGLGARRPV